VILPVSWPEWLIIVRTNETNLQLSKTGTDGIRKILGISDTVARILAVIREPQVIDQRAAMVVVFQELATYGIHTMKCAI
jgi:hypothetical protein